VLARQQTVPGGVVELEAPVEQVLRRQAQCQLQVLPAG
jgi:hypothetical protein